MSEELPELPEPTWREMRPTNPPKVGAEWFTADQMREYAMRSVLSVLPPGPPPECATEAEKTAFAFGWWSAIERKRLA